jgi:glucosamine 6-phosphate synthetase-like amidotransferase/phosphosugar isomerase protein
MKEATTAWVEASQAEKKGEPHFMKKDIIEKKNNKPQYKGLVKVHDAAWYQKVS